MKENSTIYGNDYGNKKKKKKTYDDIRNEKSYISKNIKIHMRLEREKRFLPPSAWASSSSSTEKRKQDISVQNSDQIDTYYNFHHR